VEIRHALHVLLLNQSAALLRDVFQPASEIHRQLQTTTCFVPSLSPALRSHQSRPLHLQIRPSLPQPSSRGRTMTSLLDGYNRAGPVCSLSGTPKPLR
jgi:hypothetical protein